MHRDKGPPQQMHAACSTVTRTSFCTKSSTATVKAISLEQLAALLCAAHEGRSASGMYHPTAEGHTRGYLYWPPDLLYCGGCTWTRISRNLEYYSNHLALFSTISSRIVDSKISGSSVLEIRWKRQYTSTNCCIVVCKQTVQSQYRCVCVRVLHTVCWVHHLRSICCTWCI
jgi:hypothetical protein